MNSKNKILCVIIFSFAVIILAIIHAIFKPQETVAKYRPHQTIVLSDTTNEWHDNFDSSFVYNGCLHLTNKKTNK